LYRYFKDKEELYLALLDRATSGMSVRLGEALVRARPAREQIEALVAAIFAFFDENPYLFDLIQHAEVLKRPGQAFPWQKMRDVTSGILRTIFTTAANRGEFAIDDPELALQMFLGGLRSVIRFGARPRPADLPARLVAAFLVGHAHAAPLGESRPLERSAV
jgi:AcrR family transcriptional regulator